MSNLIQLVVILVIHFLISLKNAVCDVNKTRYPLLLLSMDGFRADKLDEIMRENPNSYFKKISDNGVKAEYMIPSFPSLTFPNHWTLVTGLNVESHGIVGNVVYYPEYDKLVKLSNNNQAQYWNESEPIWLTAKKQGLKTAASYWPGSEVNTRQPDIFLSYYTQFEAKERIDMIISWFKKFQLDFACMYFDEPDKTGHRLGPKSPEYKNVSIKMDVILGYLLNQLENAKILDKINLIVVSDHGMSSLKDNQLISLGDYIDTNLIDQNRSVFNTVSGIYPNNMEQINDLYFSMKHIPNLKLYKKENVPEEYYFKNSKHIAPLVAIAEEGYRLVLNRNATNSKGAHGYNNTLYSMRAMFSARGPSFQSRKIISNFRNVNIYALMCELLNIQCNPNNGSIKPFESALKFPKTISSPSIINQHSLKSSSNCIAASSSSSSIVFNILIGLSIRILLYF